jgi:hypothetical protein
MGTARDIALIFLGLEALVIALVPLAILSGLAYGVYRLHRLAREYLRLAQVHAQQAHEAVERISRAVADPVIRVYAVTRGVTTIAERVIRRH